jgi:hypothetical protein
MIQTYFYNRILALCYLYFHCICVIVKYVNFDIFMRDYKLEICLHLVLYDNEGR